MVKLSKIKTSHHLYTQAENLFIEAFPKEERRDIEIQRGNTDSNHLFEYFAITDNEGLAGILTAWDFGLFRYIEHFAVTKEKRSAGIGAQALRQFIDMCESPIVLEVEIPYDLMSTRRIGFYQRHGFCLWETINYMQPPYRDGDSMLPMKLMSTQALDPDKDAEMVISMIYRHVYGVSE